MSANSLSAQTPTIPADASVAPGTPTREPSLLEFRHRITVAEYQRMADIDLFSDRAPIELIEGVLVRKMTIKPPHIIACELLLQTLTALVPRGWFLSMGNPMPVPEDDSEPEPDVQIIRGGPRDYRDRKHGPNDAALAIEVADSSYAFDRGVKLRVYARAGLPVYWIVDLNRRVIEVFTEPAGAGAEASYRRLSVHGPAEDVPLILDGREVARLSPQDVLP